jgi:adenylyltransferase/sulfurtransferase
MIQTLTPQEAETLIEGGNFDVVDVREPREWSTGHLPHARLVPLAELKATPKAALPRDGVIFVCARGIRSLTAAKVAESVGLTDLYNLDGGTNGWTSAGLPLVHD